LRRAESHPEQIWSALPQIADIDFSRDDFLGRAKAHELTYRYVEIGTAVKGSAGNSSKLGDQSDHGLTQPHVSRIMIVGSMPEQ
jgi:hypothetical protein